VSLHQPLEEAIAVVWMACEEVGWRHLDPGAFEEFETTRINLNDEEFLAILQASRRLTENRSSSQTENLDCHHGNAQCLFAAAYLRIWMQKLDDQTSHTIAIVSMLTHYMPVVKLSGDIGAFDSPLDAVDVILQLYEELRTIRCLNLFPSLDFHEHMAWDPRNPIMGAPDQPFPDIIACWADISPAMETNIVFRPVKSIDIISQRSGSSRHYADIPWRLLFYSVAYVIICSFLPLSFCPIIPFRLLGSDAGVFLGHSLLRSGYSASQSITFFAYGQIRKESLVLDRC
jgi:hypothetical protein